MVLIPLGTGDWMSESENYQRFKLHNMYLTDNPLAPDGVSRVSRPTLAPLTTIGTGPISGLWFQDSTLDNKWLVVSGAELYTYDPVTDTSVLVGDLPGTGFCQFAGTAARVLIVRDGTCYSTDGATITTVVMPDDVDPYTPIPADVGRVAVINGYFILTVPRTDRFYWIAPGETDPDPLSYASAERLPDSLVSVHVMSDEMWFLGETGPEVWSTTGDPDLPFQRINGRVYSEGCLSADTAVDCVFNNLPAVVWVTDTRAVAVAQGQVKIVSNVAVEELLKTGNNFRAWFLRHSRNDFYILTADEFTLVYDLSKNTWCRWDTYEHTNWLAHLGLQDGYSAFAGDSASNKIWFLEEGIDDDASLPVVREVSGRVPSDQKPTPCTNVFAKVNVGWSPSYGFQPTLELRFSDDEGNTWSDYIQASLGDKGSYSAEVLFRSLGLIVRPGRVFEFRFTDKARFRIDYATMNEPR